MKHDHAQNRPIRIGFAYGISHALSNDFLLAYQNAYPAASLEIQEWSGQICQEKLLDGELDLAILIAPFNKALLSSQTLCSGNMYIAMHRSHPLAASSEPLPFPGPTETPYGSSLITAAPSRGFSRKLSCPPVTAKILLIPWRIVPASVL